MARIDYYQIELNIQRVLLDDATLDGVGIHVERQQGMENGNHVYIYLTERDAPGDMQGMSAGQRTRFIVDFSIWCIAESFESIEEAMRLRDDLLGKTEVALMANRTLDVSENDTVVRQSWLNGGEFENFAREDGSGFASGAEIKLQCDAVASTV